MDMKIDRSLLEAYSRAEISRRDISERIDAEVGFGDLLAALHAEGLPLPRFPAHPDSSRRMTVWLTGTYVVLDVDRERMISITTRDFLEGLEEAQRINSADDVYRRAEDAGQLASRRAALAGDHERAIAAVKRLLRRRGDDPDSGREP